MHTSPDMIVSGPAMLDHWPGKVADVLQQSRCFADPARHCAGDIGGQRELTISSARSSKAARLLASEFLHRKGTEFAGIEDSISLVPRFHVGEQVKRGTRVRPGQVVHCSSFRVTAIVARKVMRCCLTSP